MDAMGRPAGTPSRALPALLTTAVLAIVLGLVGMHALSTHGSNTNAVTAHTDHATMSGLPGSHTHPADPPLAVGVSDLVEHHGQGDLIMLCAAMLAGAAGVVGAAAALLLVALGLRGVARVWTHAPTVPAAVTRWVAARLGTGPPSVWEFSVVRC